MAVSGVKVKENTFYCSYADDCWVVLAKAIMKEYSDRYTFQIPISAISQAEYDRLDTKSCAPARKSILKHIKNGPIRNAVNITSAYSALESLRKENKLNMGITWRDNYVEDLTKL